MPTRTRASEQARTQEMNIAKIGPMTDGKLLRVRRDTYYILERNRVRERERERERTKKDRDRAK